MKKVSIRRKYKRLSRKSKVVGYEDELAIDFGIAINYSMERSDILIDEMAWEGKK